MLTPHEPARRVAGEFERFPDPRKSAVLRPLLSRTPRRSAVVWSSFLLCCIVVSTSIIFEPAASATPSQWFVSPSPDSGKGINILSSVSCTSPTNCVAVGRRRTDSGSKYWTLIESWDGGSWSITPSPNPGNGGLLQGVSCVSSSFCIAVGTYYQTSGNATLVEVWDGSSWSEVSSPNPAGSDSFLVGVTCLGTTDCVAVGDDVSTSETLVESWNGTAWSIIPSPNGDFDNELSGVSCTTATNCMAVGTEQGVTLAETWDGTTWSIVSSPDPVNSTGADFSGVSCTSPTGCIAVGSYGESKKVPLQTLVETWNGTTWSITPSPSPNKNADVLGGVSCTSSINCVAAGYRGRGTTLIEDWNGSTWSVMRSPNGDDNKDGGYLSDVSCTSSTSCVAVGDFAASSVLEQTLVLTGTVLSVSPSSGPPGTSVTVSGGGFEPGETVKVKYVTGLSKPSKTSVGVCEGSAAADGTFTCNGSIPESPTAGADGPHDIEAKGLTSLVETSSTFTLEST